MLKQKAHIGKTVNAETLVVERSLLNRYTRALEIDDPIFTEREAAQKAGYSDRVLPHHAVSLLGDYQGVIDLLALKPKQVLCSREDVATFGPICEGDKLTVTTTIKDIYEHQPGGNPMGFVAIQVVGEKRAGHTLFQTQRILVVRGGFPRR